jgi:hypothetical protein
MASAMCGGIRMFVFGVVVLGTNACLPRARSRLLLRALSVQRTATFGLHLVNRYEPSGGAAREARPLALYIPGLPARDQIFSSSEGCFGRLGIWDLHCLQITVLAHCNFLLTLPFSLARWPTPATCL